MATIKYDVYTFGDSFLGQRAKKDSAIKLGEGSGESFTVRTSSGTIVHEYVKPDDFEADLLLHEQETVSSEDSASEPMTKATAFALIKEARVALRKADDAVKNNDAATLLAIAETLTESGSSITAALTAGSGIRGMR